MRVLVIGGTRFIGPRVVEWLVASGHEVAVLHRGQTASPLPHPVRHIQDDRHHLAEYTAEFRRLGPDVVLDMIAFEQEDARSLASIFRGLAERLVVLSSGDVYRAYGVFTGREQGPLEPTPLKEDAPSVKPCTSTGRRPRGRKTPSTSTRRYWSNGRCWPTPACRPRFCGCRWSTGWATTSTGSSPTCGG